MSAEYRSAFRQGKRGLNLWSNDRVVIHDIQRANGRGPIESSPREALHTYLKLSETISRKLSSSKAKILTFTESGDDEQIEKYIGISSKDEKMHFVVVASASWEDEEINNDKVPDDVHIYWVNEKNNTAGEVMYEDNPLRTFSTGIKWLIKSKKTDMSAEDRNSGSPQGSFLRKWKESGGIWFIDEEKEMILEDVENLFDGLESGNFNVTLTNAYFRTMQEMTDAEEINN